VPFGSDWFHEIKYDGYRLRLESLVSKRSDQPYRGGRSPHWIKVKNRQHHAFDRVRESFS